MAVEQLNFKNLDLKNLDAQQLLEQILSTGKDLVKQGQAQTGDLTVKGKALAAKGEDYLVDKLNLEDTEVSREALRKGVGTGAAAGALALLCRLALAGNWQRLAASARLGLWRIKLIKLAKCQQAPTKSSAF